MNEAIPKDSFIVTNNKIDLQFDMLRVCRFKRSGQLYPCPTVTEANLHNIINFYGAKTIACMLQEKLEVYYQKRWFKTSGQSLDIFKHYILPKKSNKTIKTLTSELINAIKTNNFQAAKAITSIIEQTKRK